MSILEIAVALYLGAGAVVVASSVVYFLGKLRKPADRMPCEKCQHLRCMDFGGNYKYVCYYYNFDKKPRFCARYEPRQEKKDG